MKSKKYNLSAIVFYSVIIVLALNLSNMVFAEQWGDFTYRVNADSTITIAGYTGTGGNVVIPDTIDGMPVVDIGNYAFGNRISLTSVTIPNSVTSIGERAFWGCGYLTSVIIGNSVTSIGSYAFEYCSGLTSIVVDANNPAYSSQDGVLYNKARTVLIKYPAGKSGGFTIPSSVTNIEDNAFLSCTSLTSVTIPDSVMSIGSYAFYYCSGLTSVIIPASVTSIGAGTFEYCTSLTSVTIPDSVINIGDYAFQECRSLTRAYYLGNAPLMGTHVFFGGASNFSICYTADSTGFTTPRWHGYPAKVCKNNQCAAEAIYGENAEETELLREYRDNVLSKTPEGQEIIKTYYQYSPTVTELMERRPLLRDKARMIIDSMLPGIRKKVEKSNNEP